MALPRLPRVEDVLGCRLDALTEKHLRDAVARVETDPVREAFDLEFKQGLYNDGQKADLAADVAAMANTRGGLILLGVSEESHPGAASGLNPISLSDEEERRMRNAIADRVFPLPDYEVARVPFAAKPGTGVFMLVVPRSTFAPHAAKDGGFRYFVRDGPRNRQLHETEIASAYRGRFDAARSQVDRLNIVHREALGAAPRGNEVQEWMSVALAPAVPGVMSIRHKTIEQFENWAATFRGNLGDGPFGTRANFITTGIGRIIVANGISPLDQALNAYAELHTDGCGAIAMRLYKGGTPETTFPLEEEDLILWTFSMLKLLSAHAVRNTAARGDAVVKASIGHATSRKWAVGSTNNSYESFREWRGSRTIMAVPTVTQTIDLESVESSVLERIMATRLIAAEWLHAFGVPDVRVINEDGAIRTKYLNANTLKHWKDGAALKRVGTNLDEEAGEDLI